MSKKEIRSTAKVTRPSACHSEPRFLRRGISVRAGEIPRSQSALARNDKSEFCAIAEIPISPSCSSGELEGFWEQPQGIWGSDGEEGRVSFNSKLADLACSQWSSDDASMRRISGSKAMALGKKRVLVLSDNDSVARAIELAIGREIETTKVTLSLSGQPQGRVQAGDLDLIILVLSSYNSEPVVALARTWLTDYVGQVPLLIISDRFFPSDPYTRIIHLDFPFRLSELGDRVQDILRSGLPIPERDTDGVLCTAPERAKRTVGESGAEL